MSKNRNIVVFWIDEAPREDFLTRLRDAGIQAFTADNYVDGVQWLSNPKNIEICDAVILDVNCKIRHSDEHESTDSFRDYAYRVLSRCEEDEGFFARVKDSLLTAIEKKEVSGNLIEEKRSIEERTLIFFLDLWNGKTYPNDSLDDIFTY